MADGIDDAGLPTATDSDETRTGHVHHERLIIEKERGGIPALAAISLMARQADVERSRAVDLARDHDRAVEQKRRLAILDDLEADASSALRPVNGNSSGAISRMEIRRLFQNSGWIITVRLA